MSDSPVSSVPASILLVEDESKIRYFASEVLQLEGIAVATASDGCKGLAYLEQAAQRGEGMPCVVILDLYMPCMTGWEVYQKLCAAPWASDLTVIITSAAGDDFLTMPGVAKTLVLQKPYAVKDFLGCLREAAPDLFNS